VVNTEDDVADCEEVVMTELDVELEVVMMAELNVVRVDSLITGCGDSFTSPITGNVLSPF